MKKIILLFIPILLLASCGGYFSSGEKQYLQSRNGASLVVPSPLKDSNISHFYDLPQQDQRVKVNVAPPIE